MTTVQVALRRPDGTDENAPATGRVECRPHRRRVVDDTIVLPQPFTATLVDGDATIDLAATGPDWCWQIDEHVLNGARRYVAVPAGGPVGYEDLIDVDPATLDPTAQPEAAWWTALSEIDAGTVDPEVIDTAVDTALDARLSSGGSVHLGEGDPPDLIVGAKVGDIYIDTITGTLYRLGA